MSGWSWTRFGVVSALLGAIGALILSLNLLSAWRGRRLRKLRGTAGNEGGALFLNARGEALRVRRWLLAVFFLYVMGVIALSSDSRAWTMGWLGAEFVLVLIYDRCVKRNPEWDLWERRP